MKNRIVVALLAALVSLTVYAGEAETIDSARSETLDWLALADNGEYASSWDSAAALFRNAVAKDDWVQQIGAVRGPIGALKSREAASATFSTTLPGAPDGEYVVFQFNASFANKATAVETVTAMKDPDGKWRVAGYFIR